MPGLLHKVAAGVVMVLMLVHMLRLRCSQVKAAAPSRIIFMASPAETYGKLDWMNLKWV